MINLTLPSKMVKSKMHSLFILTEGGTCLYSRNFTERFKEMDVDLITPFFSAIFSFSESVISEQLRVLELGDLRLVFEIEKSFIFIILAQSSENLILINSSLSKITNSFFHGLETLKWELDEVIVNPDFDKLIDVLIVGEDEVLQLKSDESYPKVVDFFSNMILQNDIIGAALLTNKGATLYSTLSEDILNRSMREIEIRYQTGEFDLPQLFYETGSGEKVSERMISYKNLLDLLLIVHFPSQTQFGMVDFHTESIIEKLNSFF